ncbi:hypothetical protein OJ253_1522 [Cryptosporidium canis]|uniref:Uncharacterized protein n=1 Tax=Cryptosporidium canis TaxID=195482 RepID=A0A9D5DGW1_9CRYT|nr:hypothetical protein OJ253_1522 [Cryptosporidium canis]
MRESLHEFHAYVRDVFSSVAVDRALYISSLLILIVIISLGYSYRNRIKWERAKRLNDTRMREIRENQMKAWEKERVERAKITEADCDTSKDKEEEESQRKKINKLSWMSTNLNSHMNPHFSHISTYRPSVSKRYPCKKCCG